VGFYLVQGLNALSFSVLLLLTGLGLAVVLSLMNFVNLTHGSFYLLGSYVAVYWFRERRALVARLPGGVRRRPRSRAFSWSASRSGNSTRARI
jgi:branched-subunit amino acid ABC-type transport system permease component